VTPYWLMTEYPPIECLRWHLARQYKIYSGAGYIAITMYGGTRRLAQVSLGPGEDNQASTHAGGSRQIVTAMVVPQTPWGKAACDG
jgi:hypothetical protein